MLLRYSVFWVFDSPRRHRRNPKFESQNPKQASEIQMQEKTETWIVFVWSGEGFRILKCSLLGFANDCAEDFHQFLGFVKQLRLISFKFSIGVDQTEPIAAFLRFSAANLDFQSFLPVGFVRLDVVGTNRTGGANELLGVLEIRDCSRQLLHKCP